MTVIHPEKKEQPHAVPQLGAKFAMKGCTTASKSAITAVESKPGAYYVNVHYAKYPNGAVRGQLVTGAAG